MAKAKISIEVPSQQSKLVEIYSAFLIWDIVFAGITPKEIWFYPYHSHIFARQFGLYQLPLVAMYRKKNFPYQIQRDKALIPTVIEKGTPKVNHHFQPSFFENYFLSTKISTTSGKNIIPKDLLMFFAAWRN